MSRLRALAVAGLIAIAATGCTSPFKQTPPAKLMDVYSGSPTSDDASSLLGGEWWTSAPTFSVRPLDVSNMADQIQYTVIRRYENVGTAETWQIQYIQLDKSGSASTLMSNAQNTFGDGLSGKKVGDQVLYVQQRLNASADSPSNAAPYGTLTLIRVGALVIESFWKKGSGFPSTDQLGKIATRLVNGVKDATSGKVKSAEATTDDVALLPPPNAYITLLGAVHLPVEALPLMINASAPTKVVDLFKTEAVVDFVYGDYVLNTDTSMEVQAATFTFTTASAAARMFDTFKGDSTVDSNGVLVFFNDLTGPGQYDYFIVSGRHLGLLICRSTDEDGAHEAASRACEMPLETVSAAWPAAFSD